MAKRQIDVLINARDQASKKFGTIGKATAGLSKHFGGLKASIAGVLGAAALLRFGKDVMEAYGRQEAAVKKLSDALKLVGGSSKAAMKDMQKWAASIQQQTTIGDEAVLEMAAMGAAMGKLTGEGLQKATEAAIGLSRRLSIDTTAAMRLVARAALGDTASLKRYGIVLDMASTTQQKFNELLKIGADAFVLAQGETNTFSGRVEQLKNTLGDVKEQIGQALLPIIEKWMVRIKEVGDYLGKLSTEEMQALITKIEILGGVLIAIWTAPKLVAAIGAFKTMAIGAIHAVQFAAAGGILGKVGLVGAAGVGSYLTARGGQAVSKGLVERYYKAGEIERLRQPISPEELRGLLGQRQKILENEKSEKYLEEMNRSLKDMRREDTELVRVTIRP